MRNDNRLFDQLRTIEFIPHYTKWAEGSVLVKFGDTHVLCNVTFEDRLPRWLYQSDDKHGWVTAEYAMLPRSCNERTQRERRGLNARTQEIQRLIGRSLRMSVDLRRLGVRHAIVDCDVIQADGGTRTAAITGGWVALQIALSPLIKKGHVSADVRKEQIAAVSVGIVDGKLRLDLDYNEDSKADTDMNLVMTTSGDFIEIQGTAETAPIKRDQLNELLDLGQHGCEQLFEYQRAILDELNI